MGNRDRITLQEYPVSISKDEGPRIHMPAPS
jgi:hypothetical protein